VVLGDAVLDTCDIGAEPVAAWLTNTPLPTGDTHALVCDRSDPLFPMRVPLRADGVGATGWLLLGPRPDGSFYGREERAVLQDIADPVARALAITVEREARDIEREARDEARDREIGDLRRLIGRIEKRLGARRLS
jgi:hypothetical protein